MRARLVAFGGLALTFAGCVTAVRAPVTAAWTVGTVAAVTGGLGLWAVGLWMATRG